MGCIINMHRPHIRSSRFLERKEKRRESYRSDIGLVYRSRKGQKLKPELFQANFTPAPGRGVVFGTSTGNTILFIYLPHTVAWGFYIPSKGPLLPGKLSAVEKVKVFDDLQRYLLLNETRSQSLQLSQW